MHLRPTMAAYLAAVLVETGSLGDADALASYAESHSWEDDIVTEVMWRVARAQIQAHAGEAAEAERLAREAVELAAPTDFLDLQATALLALARVLRAGRFAGGRERRRRGAGGLRAQGEHRRRRLGGTARLGSAPAME